MAMLVLDLRSCVLLVTLAQISPWLSVSMMMRFFDSCSWIKITCKSVEVVDDIIRWPRIQERALLVQLEHCQ